MFLALFESLLNFVTSVSTQLEGFLLSSTVSLHHSHVHMMKFLPHILRRAANSCRLDRHHTDSRSNPNYLLSLHNIHRQAPQGATPKWGIKSHLSKNYGPIQFALRLNLAYSLGFLRRSYPKYANNIKKLKITSVLLHIKICRYAHFSSDEGRFTKVSYACSEL